MNDEKKLINALKSNNKENIETVFEYIFNTYRSYVAFVASMYLKDRHDIDDIIQEVFVGFFNNARNVNTSIKSYLSISTKNRCINLIKKKQGVVLLNDKVEFIVSDDLKSESYYQLIDDMKSFLQPEEVELIIKHIINGLTFKEISIDSNTNENTIKTKYYSAIKKYVRECHEKM